MIGIQAINMALASVYYTANVIEKVANYKSEKSGFSTVATDVFSMDAYSLPRSLFSHRFDLKKNDIVLGEAVTKFKKKKKFLNLLYRRGESYTEKMSA